MVNSRCPLVCRCGCRSSEVCGSDGKCYCPDGTLVFPLVNEHHRLVGHSHTCPPLAETVMAEFVNELLLFCLIHSPPNFQTSSMSPNAGDSRLSLVPTASSPALLVSVTFAVLVIVTAVAMFLLRTRIKKLLQRLRMASSTAAPDNSLPETYTFQSRSVLDSMIENNSYEVSELDELNGNKIALERIKLLDEIGQGNFGQVFKGMCV